MTRRASRARLIAALAGAALIVPPASPGLAAQAAGTPTRRLTTIDAVHQFPGFFHLQNVLLRGEFVTEGSRIVLRADEHEILVLFDGGVRAPSGVVDTRGLVVDVGRLEPGDPRVGSFAEGRDAEKWPRPGEALLLRVNAVYERPSVAPVSVRSIAIEPWRYGGQTVTVIGNFRGRNLFADLPGAPGKSPYDFVLRGAEGAIWVTDLRPRGAGFDLDVNRRVDTNQWLEITGTVVHERGLVSLKATRLALAKQPKAEDPIDAGAPPPVIPSAPVVVVFNSPSELETDVSPSARIRVQFSRGLNEASLEGNIRVSYAGQTAEAGAPGLPFKVVYDGANRAIQIAMAQPFEPNRTVRVELLEGIKGFDDAPVTPWTLTFSVAF
ncbi:MAG TPA: Ig-like domain-containing protein [Vicinamibacterales bacterium]|nr:Ig-like domain-containing protein [Vicinamibacterales bacterium]